MQHINPQLEVLFHAVGGGDEGLTESELKESNIVIQPRYEEDKQIRKLVLDEEEEESPLFRH